jgi:hypothetical protein
MPPSLLHSQLNTLEREDQWLCVICGSKALDAQAMQQLAHTHPDSSQTDSVAPAIQSQQDPLEQSVSRPNAAVAAILRAIQGL